MPRASDHNQARIVADLRKLGVSVCDIHSVGHGCPDIICGWRGFTFAFEIKQPGAALTPDETAWHAAWGGMVGIIHDAAEVIEIMELFAEEHE